jgi:hypothetical protein
MELIDRHVPKGECIIAPVGDIQFGSQGCSTKFLLKHVTDLHERGAHFIGMGDYLDPMSPSNRAALKHAAAGLYESTLDLLDDAIERKVKDLYDLLSFTRKRWLGLIHGDHGWDLQDGQPADALLARKLDAPYLGDSAILQVFQKGVDRPLRIFVSHGAGSSISATGKTLHLERLLRAFEVDIVLLGHSHLLYSFPSERLKTVYVKGVPRLFAERRFGAITGSFLKGYEAHTSKASWPAGSYVERKSLAPVPLGGLYFTVKPVKHEWGWEWEIKSTV